MGALVGGAWYWPSVPIEAHMKKNSQSVDRVEPIGIIISNGEREEHATVFSAYIWGPAPEPVLDPASKAA